MRSRPILATVLIGSAAIAGCSSNSEPATPSGRGASASPASTESSHTAAPGVVGRSPAGVTTAVGAPAESTEEEYFQACHAAVTWMMAKGGDPKGQFEPYLAELQKSDRSGPGTYDVPWSKLTPGRQAAVIVAAEAASNGLCG